MIPSIVYKYQDICLLVHFFINNYTLAANSCDSELLLLENDMLTNPPNLIEELVSNSAI